MHFCHVIHHRDHSYYVMLSVVLVTCPLVVVRGSS